MDKLPNSSKTNNINTSTNESKLDAYNNDIYNNPNFYKSIRYLPNARTLTEIKEDPYKLNKTTNINFSSKPIEITATIKGGIESTESTENRRIRENIENEREKNRITLLYIIIGILTVYVILTLILFIISTVIKLS